MLWFILPTAAVRVKGWQPPAPSFLRMQESRNAVRRSRSFPAILMDSRFRGKDEQHSNIHFRSKDEHHGTLQSSCRQPGFRPFRSWRRVEAGKSAGKADKTGQNRTFERGTREILSGFVRSMSALVVEMSWFVRVLSAFVTWGDALTPGPSPGGRGVFIRLVLTLKGLGRSRQRATVIGGRPLPSPWQALTPLPLSRRERGVYPAGINVKGVGAQPSTGYCHGGAPPAFAGAGSHPPAPLPSGEGCLSGWY